MTVSQAQMKATRKYEKENYDRVLVLLPKGTKDKIKATGDTVNGFISSAVMDKLKNLNML